MDLPAIASVAMQQASTGQNQLSIAALKQQLQAERQIVDLIAQTVQTTSASQPSLASGRGGAVDVLV